MKRFTAITLAFTVSLGLLLSSCRDNSDSSSSTPSQEESIRETEYDFIKAGKSNYSIVLPDSANSYEETSANELMTFVKEATNITLNIVYESQATSAENLYVGRTQKLAKSGISVTESELTQSGYVIETIDKSVVMCGGGALGTLYSAYEFLSYTFGFEVYSDDEIYIETNVTEKKLLDFKVKDIPDIAWRNVMCAPLYTGSETSRNRMRLNKAEDVFMYVGSTWHNSLRYIPEADYYEEHPKLFGDGTKDPSDGKYKQLCYTAHGDEAEYAFLYETVLNTMKGVVKQNFDAGKYLQYITFTHGDLNAWCGCDACQEIVNTYNANSATLIRFLNPLAKDLNAWIDENYAGRTVKVVTFAYEATQDAPVASDGNGGWVPIDETVKMNEYVSVMYAPAKADYYLPLNANDEKKINNGYYTTMLQWRAISDDICFWFYNAWFVGFFAYHDSLGSMQANYQLAKANNAYYIFDQGVYNQGDNVSVFNRLKSYLHSKLTWDTELDFDELVDNFFNQYYRDAAKPMKELLTMVRLHTRNQHDNNGLSGRMSANANDNKKFWPLGTLESFLLKIEEAYDAIEYLKEKDITLYAKLYDRITCEGVAYRFLMLRYYAGDIQVDRSKQMKIALKEDCERLGFARYGETREKTMASIYAGWGLQ